MNPFAGPSANTTKSSQVGADGSVNSPRSLSITDLPQGSNQSSTSGASGTGTVASGPGSGGKTIASFLSRATSVTTSSVSGRVKSAVGSLSSAYQLGERFSSLLGAAGATGNERQRTILVIDSTPVGVCNWSQYFNECLNQMRAPSACIDRDGMAANTTAGPTATAPADGEADTVLRSGLDLIELLVVQASAKCITVCVPGNSQQDNSDHLTTSNRQRRACRVTITTGAGVVAKLEPDFVLVRQRVPQHRLDQFEALMTGLAYADVPSLQPYNTWSLLQNRAAQFGRLNAIQRRVGASEFPLITQTYCQTHQDLMAQPVQFPCLVRVGPAGGAKIRVNDMHTLRQLASLVALNNTWCIVEPWLEVKCDILIQRFGRSKIFAHTRKQSCEDAQRQYFEPVYVERRYRSWIEHASRAFDNLDMCCVKAIQTTDDREFIVAFAGTAMPLVSEQVEDDRKLVAELVLRQLSHLVYHNRDMSSSVDSTLPVSRTTSLNTTASVTTPVRATGASTNPASNQQSPSGVTRSMSVASGTSNNPNVDTLMGQTQQALTSFQTKSMNFLKRLERQDSSGQAPSSPTKVTQPPPLDQAAGSVGASPAKVPPPPPRRPPPPVPPLPVQQQQQQQPQQMTSNLASTELNKEAIQSDQSSGTTTNGNGNESSDQIDDTMKNLRKTFAGIFGDM